MNELTDLIGIERSLDEVNAGLRRCVQTLDDAVVGALHVTCSDESECECVQSFSERFVKPLLPELKLDQKSAMQSANLGGRYEWGALSIAEDHFAGALAPRQFQFLVIKINSHVGVEVSVNGQRFGSWSRYRKTSTACGALHAVLSGAHAPFVDRLYEAFQWENCDRLALLNDPQKVDPMYRSLLVAVTSARLQARRAILEIQDRKSSSPTLYLVAPCVTFNRHDHDTELLCGFYTADARGEGECTPEYTGLGDDPSKYEVNLEGGRIRINDDHIGITRQARDHRALVRAKWRQRDRGEMQKHEYLKRMVDDAGEDLRSRHPYTKAALKMLIAGMAEFAPIPAAVVLFTEGVVHAYHAHRAQKLSSDLAGNEEARHLLADVHKAIDHLPPERARQLAELLVEEYR